MVVVEDALSCLGSQKYQLPHLHMKASHMFPFSPSFQGTFRHGKLTPAVIDTGG